MFTFHVSPEGGGGGVFNTEALQAKFMTQVTAIVHFKLYWPSLYYNTMA